MSHIEVKNLVKNWSGTQAVDNITFSVPQGSLTVLLGPSGCGKSTTLRMIAGLESVSSGSIFIGGEDKTHQDAAKRGVSMVFQSYALFPHLNVRENILFGLKVRKISKTEQLTRLRDASLLVGLEDLLDRKPSQLSGGQRQRVALARTIVSRKSVCLMDEPLSNLDAQLRAEMREQIRRLQLDLGLTMLYVTHDQTEAMTMADQVILIRNGRIEQQGTPRQLYTQPASTFAAQFVGQPPMNLFDPLEIEGAGTHSINGCRIYDKTRRDWQIGIRPEDIFIADKGLAVKVEAVDYLGAEVLLRLSHKRQQFIASIEGSCKVAVGEKITVNWPAEAEHFFDDKGLKQAGW